MEDKTQPEQVSLLTIDNKITALTETIERLAISESRTQAEIRLVKDDLNISLRNEINRVMNHIDGFASQALSYQNHDKLRGGKIMEHETKIENHESRLVLLETHK